ncbi:MAG: hypothetical protein IAF38_07755 [Bacteroidia bacterium]|nr:hypothetical protein [Bacteroidia bacterium]
MPFQRCPICKNKVELKKDFPYYLCANCIEKISDRAGKFVFYQPNNTPKKFKGFYKDNPEKEYIYDICYIDGEELKLYFDKKEIFIQPLNFLKFASRPEDPLIGSEVVTMPYDPEKRKAIRKQIVIEKIIVPAGVITLLAFVPVLLGVFYLEYFHERNAVYYFSYFSISVLSLLMARRIIQSRIKKFSHASYFKQHSYAFFVIGLLATIATIILSVAHFWLK